MTEQKRRFKTTIAGRPYTIIGSKAPEHLQAVAELVEEQLSQIQGAMPVLDVEQRSVLVAVNAVSQSLERQHEIEDLKEQIAELKRDQETLLQQLYSEDTQVNEHPEQVASHAAEPESQAKSEQPEPTAKKASLRFVRPTTASQAFLQRAEMLEKKDRNSSVADKQTGTEKGRNNTSNRDKGLDGK